MTNLSEKLWKKHVFPTYWRNKICVLFHGHFCSFTGIVFCFFSRASIWVSRARFYEKFHGHFCVFTCTFYVFSGFFTGTIFFSRGKKHWVKYQPISNFLQPMTKKYSKPCWEFWYNRSNIKVSWELQRFWKFIHLGDFPSITTPVLFFKNHHRRPSPGKNKTAFLASLHFTHSLHSQPGE